jgi:hypothetical protein
MHNDHFAFGDQGTLSEKTALQSFWILRESFLLEGI